MSVTVFSSGCPKCCVLEQKLVSKGIEYQTVQDFTEILSKGFQTLPVLKVGENYYDFSQAIKWVNNGGNL